RFTPTDPQAAAATTVQRRDPVRPGDDLHQADGPGGGAALRGGRRVRGRRRAFSGGEANRRPPRGRNRARWWCRRDPGVAGSLVVVVFAIGAGTTGASVFAVQGPLPRAGCAERKGSC